MSGEQSGRDCSPTAGGPNQWSPGLAQAPLCLGGERVVWGASGLQHRRVIPPLPR